MDWAGKKPICRGRRGAGWGGAPPPPYLPPHNSGSMTPGSLFHPAVAAWFERSFAAPTAAQAQAWPAFQAGRHVLIAGPTGSGETLAAFLAAIDCLARQGLERGLKDQTQLV